MIFKTKKKFDDLVNYMPENVGSVLDVGGGTGGLFFSLMNRGIKNYTLLENNQACLAEASKMGCDIIKFDINSGPWPIDDSTFEIVVLSDVLEHVFNPWAVLAEASRVSSKYVLIYGPNFASLACRFDLLRGRPIRQMSLDKYGAIKDEGGVGMSHIFFITYKNIIHWTNRLNLQLVKSSAFWYRRYKYVRWILDGFFKNFGAVYLILLKKEERNSKLDDNNFKY